ncbi:hypothetical protein T11_18217 [Trichinella zimbabwensis]|uniref:Uncharacterized protein n=1 Tax=Trichinella zimbabwensis TaxID=268475 RepID=A0A0V1GWV5_9BILA|nr:hypothetical protein T11_18217 [Trichinella zimbabwensis]
MTQSCQMSSSKRADSRKVNSDGDGPDENSKAEADPPTVTANPKYKEEATFIVNQFYVSLNQLIEDNEQ